MSASVPCPAEPHGLCPHQPHGARAWISSERSKCLCRGEASGMWTWCSTYYLSPIRHSCCKGVVHISEGAGKMVFSPLEQHEGKEEKQCCKSHPRSSVQGLPDPVEPCPPSGGKSKFPLQLQKCTCLVRTFLEPKPACSSLSL